MQILPGLVTRIMKRRRITQQAVTVYQSILNEPQNATLLRRTTTIAKRLKQLQRPSVKDKWASSSDEDEEDDATSTTTQSTSKSSNSSSSSSTTQSTSTTSRSVDCYEQIKALGEGQYGTVWQAKNKSTGKIVALKEFKLTNEVCGAEGFPSSALREINVLQSVRHPNIIRVHEVVVGRTTDKIYIVMDYVPVELGTLMINMGDQPFSLADSKCLLKQLLDAVSFLHDRLLVHRDIKPTNILYHGSGPKLGTLVLCDFGLTRRLSKNTVGGGNGGGNGGGSDGKPQQQQLSPLVVTLYYRAVEILLGNGYYDESIDVWSIGCVFAELMLNKVLLPGKGEIDQLSLIFNTLGGPTPSEVKVLSKYLNSTNINWSEISTYPCKIASLLEHLDCGSVGGTEGEAKVVRNVVDLLKGMLRYDCNARLTAKEAKKHSFFSDEPRATALNCMPMIEM